LSTVSSSSRSALRRARVRSVSPGDRHQVVAVASLERGAACEPLPPPQTAQLVSGGDDQVTRLVQHWVRALFALRCMILSARNASTAPSWLFAGPTPHR